MLGPEIVLTIVGNKIDLTENVNVHSETAERYVLSIISFLLLRRVSVILINDFFSKNWLFNNHRPLKNSNLNNSHFEMRHFLDNTFIGG